MFRLALLACGLGLVRAADLTPETFAEATSDVAKPAFIKFYAPWCGHCKALAPDWERLEKEYAASDVVTVASVDCTTQEDLCARFDVRGYPSINTVIGDFSTAYEGARDLDALRAHVETSIVGICDALHLDHCSAEERDEHEAIMSLGARAIYDNIESMKAVIAAARDEFDSLGAGLRARYESAEADMRRAVTENSERMQKYKAAYHALSRGGAPGHSEL